MVFLGGPHQGPPRMDQDATQAAKVAVEDREREPRKKEPEGMPHVPRFFEQRNGWWEPMIT
jgi:hypothetical protein